jgi:hypothetical protein
MPSGGMNGGDWEKKFKESYAFYIILWMEFKESFTCKL